MCSSDLDNNAGFQFLVQLAEGTGNQDRIGRRINLHNLYLTGKFENATAVCLVRLVLARYRHTNGVSPQITDLLQGGISTSNINNFKNLEDSKNARILWDHTWRFTSAFAQNGAIFRKKFRINKKVYFTGATAAHTDVRDGQLVLFVFSDQTDASGISPNVNINARIRYTDA